MSHDKLAYMANQIGRFFQSQKPDTAVAEIEEHIRKFWDPRMRKAIIAQLAEGRIELDPPVRQAIERLGKSAPA
jgi:formate dehydrogenase subunit delta